MSEELSPPALDPLGAFVAMGSVARSGAPRGSLAGVGFAVKDLFDIAGHVSSCGNPDWQATHEPASKDAPSMTALLAAGASLVGATVMDELAYSLAGENVHQGTPRNARAPGRVCGGSSSGSAAAVAGGACEFALGTDTGGSIRVPASYTGLYGLRPTHGRIPLQGVMPLSPSYDTIGWFGNTGDLLRRVGEVLLGEGARPVSPRRLLRVEEAWELLEPEARARLDASLDELSAETGWPVEPVRLAPEGLQHWFWVFRRIQAREIWAVHGRWIEETKPRFGPGIRERFAAAQVLAARSELRAEDDAARATLRRRIEDILDGSCLLALPSAACAAPRVSVTSEQLERLRDHTLRMTCLAGHAGVPQLSLPLAELEGAPLGLGLAAGAFQDEALLQLAAECTSRNAAQG